MTRTYSYDIENRLIGASVPGGSQVQLGYDPLGRLSWTTGSPNFTRFLYDGDALVAEYDYAGTMMTKRYAHWVGADVPLVSYEGATLETATARWLFADHQGSIIAAAHPSGATDWVNTYDEYGIPGKGNAGRFQYTGQIWLPELGMYHYKARIYSPTLGRFLQTDPVGYQDQFNLYAYVGNDPVNHTDPTGTEITVKPGDERRVARMVNNLTNDRYRFQNGRMRRDSVGRGRTGSRISSPNYYDRRLQAAIASDKTTRISLGETVTYQDSNGNRITRSIYDREFGGAATFIDLATGNSDVVVGITRDTIGARDTTGNLIRQTPSDRLMHELLVHAIPAMTGIDTGNGFGNENRLRRERGMPERAPDPVYHPVGQ